MFDIARQRGTVREQLRIADLMSLTPKGKRVLEIGARDCYLSRKLTALYPEVVALDLTKPEIDAPGITAVQGDVTGLRFANNAFDTVFCTEVLEHVPPEKLQQACNEIVRVASRYAVIGVPYRQDLRANRTRCLRCGAVNPTTGHLNRFDRQRLTALFPGMTPREIRSQDADRPSPTRCRWRSTACADIPTAATNRRKDASAAAKNSSDRRSTEYNGRSVSSHAH